MIMIVTIVTIVIENINIVENTEVKREEKKNEEICKRLPKETLSYILKHRIMNILRSNERD